MLTSFSVVLGLTEGQILLRMRLVQRETIH